MNYEQLPAKKEFEFSNEDLLNGQAFENVFQTTNFQEVEKFFIENRTGKFSCSITILGNTTFLIKTINPIEANNLAELKNGIEVWANEELAKIDNKAVNQTWTIKSFSLDYDFVKDGNDVQTGYRKIV